jgi:hypothetical protein
MITPLRLNDVIIFGLECYSTIKFDKGNLSVLTFPLVVTNSIVLEKKMGTELCLPRLENLMIHEPSRLAQYFPK